VVLAYFKISAQNMPGWIEETMKILSIRIARIPDEIRTRYLSTARQEC
jgi:hypothetical protein